jgi:hypothetical protein
VTRAGTKRTPSLQVRGWTIGSAENVAAPPQGVSVTAPHSDHTKATAGWSLFWYFAPPVCANQLKELADNKVYLAMITTNTSRSRMVRLYKGNIRRRTGGENSSSRVVWSIEGSQMHTRPVRKVSSHSEYLGSRSRGLDVIWQPVRGDLSVHP